MFEVDPMIVPQKIETVKPVNELLNIAYRLVDGKILERVVYQGSQANVYRASTDVLLRTHFSNKPILNAFYHDFGTASQPSPYLCIASEDELKLICIETNECHTNCLPIKIQQVLPTVHGLLLVRSENDDSDSSRGPNILYSLSHPYSELLPVLCRLKDGEHKPFIFMHRKIQLIQAIMESKFVLGYDVDENTNYLFNVRLCSESEKQTAREHLMESTAIMDNSNADILPHISPIIPFTPIANKSALTQRSALNFTGSQSQSSWRTRYRKASTVNETFTPSRLDISQTMNSTGRVFANLSQNASQHQRVDSTKAALILTLITGEKEFDPNAVEIILECVWTDEVTRLSGKSPSRLPILSPLQTSAPIAQRSNRSRTKLEKEITEQINSCVTNKPTQTFITSDLNDRNFFVFNVPGNKLVKIFPYHDNLRSNAISKVSTIQASHAIPLLGTKFWIAVQNSPVLFTLYSGVKKIADLSVSCVIREPELLGLNYVHQLICREGTEFELIAEFRPTVEPSPTKEPASKKARRGVISPQKRQNSPDPFESTLKLIRQSNSQPNQRVPYSSPLPKSLKGYSQPPLSEDEFVMPIKDASSNVFQLVKVQLNPGTTTLMGKRLHDTILSSLSDRNKLEFEKEWLCRNTYRYVQEEFSQMVELEIALLFESLFEAIGINPTNFPFTNLASIKKAKEGNEMRRSMENKPKIKKEEDGKYSFLNAFLGQLKPDEKPLVQAQRVEAKASKRESFISVDHVGLVFQALHKFFDSLKRNKDTCVLRARRSMAQPLFIMAGLYNIQLASNLYVELYPELKKLQIVPLRQSPRVVLNDQKISFDVIDQLCEPFDMEFATKRPLVEPVLNNIQRNKLRVLPTQSEIGQWIKMRWPTDIRVSNVNTMLDSSKPVLIPDLRISTTMSDSQLREYQEKFLLNVALRTITRSFGAALLNFHSKQAEPMEVAITEKICLHGKISPNNMKLEYPIQDQPPAKLAYKQMMEWANFYNGVSRGLATILNYSDNKHFGLTDPTRAAKELKRVGQVIASQTQKHIDSYSFYEDHHSRRQIDTEDEGPSVVDWEWVFSKIKENKECSPALAGFILAAGLSGQSMSVNPFDLHEFLSLSDKLVVVSLLLGTSVAYRGTSNFYINKMIYAHLPFLLQPTLCDFRIEPVIQTVALLSLGYLFAKSMNSQLTNDLINQMSKETFFETDLASERYAYVLSAGFAVGLINLGKGREIELLEKSSASNHHLSFHERLFLLLNGGRRDLCIVNYQKDMCSVAQKGCCSCGMSRSDQKFLPTQHQHHHRQRADFLTAAGAGGGGVAGAAGNPNAIASNVAAASSHVSELSTINIHLSSPAACVAFALVYMRTNLEQIAKKLVVPSKIYYIRLIRPDVIMLRTLASCLIMFDSISNTAQWVEKQIPVVLRSYGGKKNATDADLPMLLRSYIYVRTGACFAMALKYTSTRDERTTRILLQWFNELVDDFEKEDEIDSKMKICGTNTYVTCINVMMSALAIVNAGSGDVSLVKQFRRVRNSNTHFTEAPKESTLYSAHIVSNMCLGLLFLGNGRYGLGSSNMSLASLLISFFPIYGHSIYDNRCYFQGFRFLWTLAVEPRFLVTVAEGYQESVVAPLEIGFKDENMKPINDKTPYLLPPLELISIIRIKAPDYQPIDLDLQKPEDMHTLREILTNLSGRLPLKKPKRACGSHEFRTLDPKVLAENDVDLSENLSDHSFSEDTV